MHRSIRLSTLALTLTTVLAGCASAPKSLDELPRTPDASVEEILKSAARHDGAEANLLRLHANFNTKQPPPANFHATWRGVAGATGAPALGRVALAAAALAVGAAALLALRPR